MARSTIHAAERLSRDAKVDDGRVRVAIEAVSPQIDGGRFPIKRVWRGTVRIAADIFADGHDEIAAELRFRADGDERWNTVPLRSQGEDRWEAQFVVDQLGSYSYTMRAWIDHFATWRRDASKRVAAEQPVDVDRLIGADLISEATSRARGTAIEKLEEYEDRLRTSSSTADFSELLNDHALVELMSKWAPRRFAAHSAEFRVVVDRERAAVSAWYEMFPRSAGDGRRHGTLRDVEARLPYVESMGFDVLYLPPIHPIGLSYRKGPNNSVEGKPDDVGSPWAIGSSAGGHKEIHPELGTIDDFRRLVAAASRHGLELALDLAFQCSPDHPYVTEHPEWFKHRPDGSIQYAENPPKKYQDIYPLDFECDDWRALWNELKSIVLYWIDQGIRIFRVDNPHTKPFAFWEWLIAEIKRVYPETIFLAEAFTRRSVMYRLAKLGFTQSYTYYTWQNSKHELTQYFNELSRDDVRNFFRPNLWPNTPDILPASLQNGGRAAFMARAALAATLGGNFGIYGPPFEHGWSVPLHPGSEEYINSEKFQIHQHDLNRPDSLQDFIARLNAIRRESPALAHGSPPEFLTIHNDQLISFSRVSSDLRDVFVVVVNLHPHEIHSGWLELPLERLHIAPNHPYQMHDLITNARYEWSGEHNFVQLVPWVCPVHVFRVRRYVHAENGQGHFV
jgi:starch synthase (maltosyl-transferring)